MGRDCLQATDPDPVGARFRVATTAYNPSFSPDGTRIAFVRGGTIWTMKAIAGLEGTDQDDTHVAGSDSSWGPYSAAV